MKSWRVLITNATLAGRSGTETLVRDLALALRNEGLRITVYSPEIGDLGEEIRAAGIPVVSDLRDVEQEPDIISGNHHVETLEAMFRFPRARGVFVCHDRLAAISAPPRIGRIRRYVAVDHNCLERLTDEYAIPRNLTRVIYNSVDTARFTRRKPLPSRPRRALVFSNYARPGTHLAPLQAACARFDLPLDVVGAGTQNSCAAPELILSRYDLVFAKARCALEAMATGAAVVLCDSSGLGPMVTLGQLADLRPWNFGMRVLRESLDPEGIIRQIERYDAADAAAVTSYIREFACLSKSVQEYVNLYTEVMEGPQATLTTSRELHDYLLGTAARIHELETELAHFRRPYRMEPLSDSACAGLVLHLASRPEEARAGERFLVRVELLNGSVEKLGSYPPCPLHFSYRWLSAEGGDPVVAEGLRTLLRPPLSPAEKANYDLNVVAPSLPGRYRLRVTLVQETVRWLDHLAAPISAEAEMSVVPSV